ncbi:MAG: peptidoglycan-binding protein [Deltaproteobacteria bacterium]|nr:peptidoglycan-binding protein [Deltaproteobacteria bacterium]
MNPQWLRTVLAGSLILSLTLPGWAAEEKKAAPAKEEKVEKKAPPTGTEDIKKLQEALKAKGHDPGPIDGIMGPKTRVAIKAFQKASGLKETGELDDQTAEKVGVEKPKPPAKEVKKEVKEKKEEKK